MSERRGILLTAPVTPLLTWRVLSELGVTNFLAAPTIYRALRGAADVPPPMSLRCLSSAGEPLTPDVNELAVEALGVAVHDQYGQTEHGMLVNNHHHREVRNVLRPGSMGRPMPGWRVAVLADDRDEPALVGSVGRVAIDVAGSPLFWFGGYQGNDAATRERYTTDGSWYLTGDAGRVDDDGSFTFSSRDDDVIIMSGYRIGPFEVETALASHPAVAESAVIAVPDAVRGEIVEAFVVLRAGHAGSTELERELQQAVKHNFAAHAYPRVVHFVDALPKTPSGKTQRFLLRQQRRDELAAASAASP